MGVSGALGARQSRVLRAVVGDYIRSAEPVGSGSIAGRYRLGVSPATIRNDMSALEDMGYLAQPHTSAGRVPTDLGYRFYVDTLPRRLTLAEVHRRAIAAFFGETPPDVEEVLRRTAALLSRVTRYAAVALSPDLEASRVARAELVALGGGALLLVVSDTGRVDKRAVEVPEEGADEAVRRVSQALERSFSGLTYAAARSRAERLARGTTGTEEALFTEVAEGFRELEQGLSSEHVFVGGASNIAGEEAFERRETVRRLFEALEEEAAILRFLRDAAEAQEVAVLIGRENPVAAMREAAVVVAPYLAGGRPAGTVAVIGPRRMHYPNAISAVRAVARNLSGLIETLAG
ncbi:MAG: heat-inducible transcriptional repressor HrcA [Actinomycetota bacterium]